LLTLLDRTGDRAAKLLTLGELQADYEATLPDFEEFWYSETMDMVRSYGLLVV
jgi:hypothetical protein